MNEEPGVQSDLTAAPKLYFALMSGSVTASHSPLGRGPNVDLENLFHGVLQFFLEVDEAGGPAFGELGHPAVVDQPDGNRVEVVQLLAAPSLGDDQPCLFQQTQVLGHPDAGHVETLDQGIQRLPVAPEQLVEQFPPCRVGQRLEHQFHA